MKILSMMKVLESNNSHILSIDKSAKEISLCDHQKAINIQSAKYL